MNSAECKRLSDEVSRLTTVHTAEVSESTSKILALQTDLGIVSKSLEAEQAKLSESLDQVDCPPSVGWLQNPCCLVYR